MTASLKFLPALPSYPTYLLLGWLFHISSRLKSFPSLLTFSFLFHSKVMQSEENYYIFSLQHLPNFYMYIHK